MLLNYNKYNNDLILENVKDSKKWLEDNNIDVKHKEFIEIRDMLQSNPNLTLMFTKFHFRDNVKIDELEKVYDLIKKSKDFLNKLNKKVTDYDDFEDLSDDLRDNFNDQMLIRFQNEMPSFVKAYFNNLPQDKVESFREVAKGFYTLDKETRNLFLKKISRYKEGESLLSAFSRFVSNYTTDFTYEKTLENIKKLNGVELKYYNDDKEVIVIRLLTFQAAQNLCSMTSWCIKDYEHQWTSYVGGEDVFNIQYVIFNYSVPYFDKYSVIGYTVESDGTSRAIHLKDDDELSEEQFFRYVKSLGVSKSVFSTMGKREQVNKSKLYEMLRELKTIGDLKTLKSIRTYNKVKNLIQIIISTKLADLNVIDGVLPLVIILNDDLDTLKLMVNNGLNINNTIAYYSDNDDVNLNYVRDFDKFLLYDVCLLTNANKIIDYLKDTDIKKINIKRSFYLYRIITEKSDEEIINALLKVEKNEIRNIIIYDNKDRIEFDLFDFIFYNKSLKLINDVFNIIPKDESYNTNDYIKNVAYDLNKTKEDISDDKINFLLSTYNNFLNSEKEAGNNRDKQTLKEIIIYLTRKDKFEIINKNIAIFKKLAKIKENIVFDEYYKKYVRSDDDENENKDFSKLYYLFNTLNFIPNSADIISEFVSYLIKSNKESDLDKIFTHNIFNISVENEILTQLINENPDYFFIAIEHGLDANSGKFLEYYLESTKYNNKYFKNVNKNIFEYLTKNLTYEIINKKNNYGYNNFNTLIDKIIKFNSINSMVDIVNKFKFSNDIDKDVVEKILDFLIKYKKDVTLKIFIEKMKSFNKEIESDFEIFIKKENRVDIKKYLDLGVNVSKRGLQVIFDEGKLDFLKYLVSIGVEFISKTNKYDTPNIHVIIKNQNIEFLKYLYENGYKNNWDFDFESAINTGNIELVKYLIETGDYNDMMKSGFINAISNKQLEIAKYLYDYKKLKPTDFNVDKSYYSYNNSDDVISAFINSVGDIETLNYLLEKDFKIEEKHIALLFEKDLLPLIKYLFENKIIKLKDEYIGACRKSATLQFMLDNAFKITDKTEKKYAALSEVFSNGSDNTITLFLSNYKNLYTDKKQLTDILDNKVKNSEHFGKPENIIRFMKEFKDKIDFITVYDNNKRHKMNDKVREYLKVSVKYEKKTTKNENNNNMKYLKTFEDYGVGEKETEVEPITKPKTAPTINPIKPPKPVVIPSPKNLEEETKKVINRFNRLKNL